ncbi:MAG TPA: NADH-ubiquinone oxidoreductase-F iron-sulfur binding region domain-containing protein, partial [Nitrospiria bacterium]|nr:NADH-ubiquinone oxidoreductase-F iron-sulfur binding region domain-containing protein [Nitrospiria bacterium]
GTSLRKLVYECGGGMKDGKELKVVYPGGPSQAFLLPKDLDTPMDFDSLKGLGSGLGSAGVIALDETTCMVERTMTYCRFFEKESCGQCPPCQMGTHYLHQTLEKIETGKGKPEDIETLKQLSGFVKGRGDCTVVTSAATAVQTGLEHFSHEFEEHLKEGRCTFKVAG